MHFARPLGISNGSVFLLSIAAVASALSIAIIFDYPELPFDSFLTASSISSISTGLLATFSKAGLVGLFALMFLESLSLPIPSELFLPLAGYYAYLGKMNLFAAIGVSTIAGLSGSLAAYYLALLLGRPLIYAIVRKLGTGSEALERSEQWLNGWGSAAVLISRFIPGFRSSISFPAGALRMSVIKFSVMTILGSFGWSALLIYIGYSAGPLWQSSSAAFFDELSLATPYLIIGASASYVAYFLWKRTSSQNRVRYLGKPSEAP
jgi:membrane protein DedA with SNARE-associated domain